MLFELSDHERDGWLVLAPVGEIDLASAPRLRQQALQHVLAGSTRVVIDLGGVDFLDSMGAGVLIAVHKRLAGLGGVLRLARPEPHVRRTLALAGVDRVLAVVDSLDEAVLDTVDEPTADRPVRSDQRDGRRG